MASSSVFRWLDGRGWLILAGGEAGDVRATALGRLAADGAVACVSLSGDGDRLLDDIEDLGAPSGYLVDVFTEDDETLHDRLSQAGMVIIEGGASPIDVRAALRGAALDGIQEAFGNGAIVLTEGVSAAAFGAWLLDAGLIVEGLEWVESAAVIVGSTQPALDAAALFAAQPASIAVGVAADSALALGPDGEIELWGERGVTIALGVGYQQESSDE